MRWWAHGRTSQRAHRDVRHRTRASKNDAETIGGNMGQLLALALFACPLIAFAATPGSDAAGNVPEVATGGTTNDYPTATRADYVFGCMAVNGQTHEALDRCSCAIDVIASILPYQDYLSAETVLRMQQAKSFLAMEFQTDAAKQIVRRLREAEAEGEVRCF
jgi:hypothetical protein